jgi:hypothetical protein
MSNVLDTPPTVDPSSVPFTQTVIRYGVIGGLIMVIYSLLGNITGLSNPSSGIAMTIIFALLSFVIYIAVMVMGVRKHRDEELGGYVSFGRTFLVGFLIAVIMGVIGQIFNFFYLNFIDPDYLANSLDGIREMYENMGMDENMIEDAMVRVESQFESQKSLWKPLPGVLGVSAFIAAIVGLIMKKKEPETM